MVTPEEQELIYERMAEAGIQNMGAYMRKMALNGYVLHVDLADVRELVSLQRRCANNLNQVAIHANTYGIYPSEIAALQKELLISPLTCKVYVVAFLRFIVSHNGAYEIIRPTSFHACLYKHYCL